MDRMDKNKQMDKAMDRITDDIKQDGWMDKTN